MPTYIVKPKPDVDFYVAWSTVVDAPSRWGTREEFANTEPEERLARADKNGTSMNDPDDLPDKMWFGWQESQWIVTNLSGMPTPFCLVKRDDVQELCRRLDDGEPVAPVLIPIDDE